MNSWKRYELKDRAKQVLKINYWVAFVVALIFVFANGGLSLPSGSARNGVNFQYTVSDGEYSSLSEFLSEFPDDLKESFADNDIDSDEIGSTIKMALPFIITAIIIIGLIAFAVGIAFNVFLLNPIKLGCKNFFKTSAESPHQRMKPVGLGFRNGNYGNVVKTMFFRDLYLFLWSLLFIIPGWIKYYSYRMVPYILADNPKMDANEAITLSRRMMDGQKWKTFVLDLSFIGWYLLGFIALIIGTLFVHPYFHSTEAQLYLVLRDKARDEGVFPVNEENLIEEAV